MAEIQLICPNVLPRVKGLLPTGEVNWCGAGFMTGWSIVSSQNPSEVSM